VGGTVVDDLEQVRAGGAVEHTPALVTMSKWLLELAKTDVLLLDDCSICFWVFPR
jgi:hypothetical protein